MPHPDGKILPDDEGALQVMSYIQNGRLILNFGKQVSWLGLDKLSLRNFIDGLEDQYNKL